MHYDENTIESIPVGVLGLIPMSNCSALGEKVDKYLVQWRHEHQSDHKTTIAFKGFERDTYIVNAGAPRFGTGEAKGIIKDSIRGYDLFIMTDVTNYHETYTVCGQPNHKSPDDHYADLKRIIAAAGGKARRITVIMTFLYEGRQHRRNGRESMDCAMMLQELTNMGVENIITFDAHDPRVQNAIPLAGFEIDSEHMMAISPDEGATSRAVYLASILGINIGMFYKRRDYSRIVNGRNPIIAHEFLGASVEGKDVMVIDDMISSGDSMIDVATELKKRKAKRIFVMSTFGLFTNGLEKIDKAVEDGIIYRVITTNLIYQTPELLSKPYYISCDMSKYIAYIVDTLNHDTSISDLLNPYERIKKIVTRYRNGELSEEK